MLSLHQLALSFGSFARDDPDILEKPAPPMCRGLKATNFVPYFNYAGNLTNVEGILTIYPHPDGSRMIGLGHLSGIDPMCSSGPNTGVNANSCGVHIHKGTSCTEDAEGHYYDTSIGSDPWGAGYYTANSDGTAETRFALMAGTSSSEITGKAVIVHDYNGGRIGCALLEMPLADQVAAPFGKYYNVADDLSDYAKQMSGVQIYSTPEKTVIYFLVMDVDPACAAGPDTTQGASPNSCGIHIHKGTSCSDDALGHYYDETSIGSDPWGAGYYEAESEGQDVYAAGDFSLTAGLDQAAITGKTLIVHNHAGGKTHCAPIHEPKGHLGVGDFIEYPGYQGALTEVAGSVIMTHLPDGNGAGSVMLEAVLVNVDPRCSEDSNAANGCGIHIHSGYDCADADTIGGHLYAGESDPWSSVAYQVHGRPGSPGTGSGTMVPVGMSAEELVGRAFVVHDFDGARIACGYVSPPAVAC